MPAQSFHILLQISELLEEIISSVQDQFFILFMVDKILRRRKRVAERASTSRRGQMGLLHL